MKERQQRRTFLSVNYELDRILNYEKKRLREYCEKICRIYGKYYILFIYMYILRYRLDESLWSRVLKE